MYFHIVIYCDWNNMFFKCRIFVFVSFLCKCFIFVNAYNKIKRLIVFFNHNIWSFHRIFTEAIMSFIPTHSSLPFCWEYMCGLCEKTNFPTYKFIIYLDTLHFYYYFTWSIFNQFISQLCS